MNPTPHRCAADLDCPRPARVEGGRCWHHDAVVSSYPYGQIRTEAGRQLGVWNDAQTISPVRPIIWGELLKTLHRDDDG